MSGRLKWRTAAQRGLRRSLFVAADFTCQRCGWRPQRCPDPETYDGRYTPEDIWWDGKPTVSNHWNPQGSIASQRLDVDHIHPRHAGGTNDRSNLQVLCTSCNCSKGHKTEETT